jgi:hypothetical protein
MSKFQSRRAIFTKIPPKGVYQSKIKLCLQRLNAWRLTKIVNGPLKGKRGRGIKRWRYFRSGAPPSGRTYIFANYTKTITDRRNMSIDRLGNRGRGVERWRHFRSRMPPCSRIYILAKCTKTTKDRRKISMDHLQKIWIGDSNGDVTSGLEHHLAAEFTFSQNTRKPSHIDEKCQSTTYRKSGSVNRTAMPFPD